MPKGKKRDYSSIDPETLSVSGLRQVVRQMAAVADKRLLTLEKSGAYQLSSAVKMENKRRHQAANTPKLRFRRGIGKMKESLLKETFYNLRDFLVNPESNASTVLEKEKKRKEQYEKARQLGYRGSIAKLNKELNSLWTKVNEKLLSSDIAWYLQESYDIDAIKEVVDSLDYNEKAGHSVGLLRYVKNIWKERTGRGEDEF